MNPILIAKGIVSIASSVGATTVVNQILKSFAPTAVSTLTKVSWVVGSVIVSGMVSQAAVDYTETSFDNVTAIFKKDETESATK